jgi:alanine racemase
VSLARLRDNLAAIKAHVAPSRVMVILKANAYGHGLEAVARCLAPQADAFGVALVEEGIVLRRMGIENPILVMGGIWTRQIPLFLENDLTLTVPSLARLRDVEEAAAARGATARVHLKVDTGMERIGVHHSRADGLLEAAARSPHVEVEGLYSHFANADAEDLDDARRQLSRFQEVLRFYERHSLPLPERHMANSAALLRLPESHMDMVRSGILVYGVYPFPGAPRHVQVRPALAWKSRVVYFKVVEPGRAVSYGGTWSSDHPVRVVTVPVGYGDGYFRSLSNRAELVLRGRRYRQVGRICMDQLMVNIEWGTGYNGDEVVLIGEQGDERVTVEELAEWAGTVPYEVLTAINDRVPRLYEG